MRHTPFGRTAFGRQPRLRMTGHGEVVPKMNNILEASFREVGHLGSKGPKALIDFTE